MSYILEALRRSQAERERGRVPGLDAQPLAPTSAAPARGWPTAWVAGALGLALVLVVLAATAWWGRRPPPSTAPAGDASVASGGAPGSTGAARGPDLTAPASPPSAQATSRQPLPQVVSVAPPPPAPVVTALPAPVVNAPPAPPVATPPAAQVPAPPKAAVTAAPPHAARALTLAELPAEQRRELPPLVVGGSVWSDHAPNRFVILNGQVVREGEAAAPGVVLERIGPKAVVLRWREQRIELPL
jgi:general secretion pathway protein B